MALYWGGAVVAGAAIGGAVGFFAGGVGAVPGAAIGAAAGNLAGQWLLGLLGLKAFAEGLWHTLPPALKRYESGFKKAWDAARTPHAGSWSAQHFAAHDFAEGHVLLLCAVLMLLLACLARNGIAGRAQALADIAKSPRLGPCVAQWLDEHEAALVKHPALQAKPLAQAAAPRREVAAVQWRKVDDRFSDDATTSTATTSTPTAVGKAKSRSALEPDVLAARQATANAYYKTLGWDDARILSHTGGIDFSQSVEVVTLPKGSQVVQYQVPGNPVGGYFAPVGTSAESLGISSAGRVPVVYVTTQDVSVLRSTAADTSMNLSLPESARGAGGGIQYFTNNRGAFAPSGG